MARKKKTKKKTSLPKKLKRLLIMLVILIIIFLILCLITPSSDTANGITANGSIKNLELPAPIDGEQIISHTGYTLSYNEEYELPSWVAYTLTRDEVLGTGSREDDFREDPLVRTGSASLSDYRGSGYDRGHMAPAADFKWSAEAMSDTFYLSNMCPQEPSFNRGIWADLEAVVRTMAYDNGEVHVVTGPVLTDGPYETIGKNEVAIPKQFYKVVLDYTDPDIKAIGFVLPNEGSDKALQSYAMSVDEVEEITGIDFYPSLPDDQEEAIESKANTADWNFTEFIPTGEMPDESQFEYVSPSSPKDMVLNEIISLFVDIKTEVFSLLGIEEIASSFGLI